MKRTADSIGIKKIRSDFAKNELRIDIAWVTWNYQRQSVQYYGPAAFAYCSSVRKPTLWSLKPSLPLVAFLLRRIHVELPLKLMKDTRK